MKGGSRLMTLQLPPFWHRRRCVRQKRPAGSSYLCFHLKPLRWWVRQKKGSCGPNRPNNIREVVPGLRERFLLMREAD